MLVVVLMPILGCFISEFSVKSNLKTNLDFPHYYHKHDKINLDNPTDIYKHLKSFFMWRYQQKGIGILFFALNIQE